VPGGIDADDDGTTEQHLGEAGGTGEKLPVGTELLDLRDAPHRLGERAGRRTITAMTCAGGPEGDRAHDAYHRLVRAARWSTNALWRVLVVHLVDVLAPTGLLVLDCDGTLYNKSGRKVDGAGSFWDALRPTRKKVVYATGLNLVVVTLRVRPPWPGKPIGVPVGIRQHRKDGPTTLNLACEIVTEIAPWLPERSFSLCADGAYASLARRCLPWSENRWAIR